MEKEMSYTGWFPTVKKPGNGIGVTDNKVYYEGEWQPVSGFPNSGYDVSMPEHLISYDLSSFESRVLERGIFDWLFTYNEIKAREDKINEEKQDGSLIDWEWWSSKDRWWNYSPDMPTPEPEQPE